MRLAVIPARGGSKRIPRKNLREFAGRPIIAYSIRAALECGCFDRVIVSTDDADISAVALNAGADVPFVRPPELSDDHAGTTEVVAHAVHWANLQGLDPQQVCCIYPTAPFIDLGDLRNGEMLLRQGNWQYVFPATSFDAPIFRSFKSTGSGGIEMFFPEHFATRSQDLPLALHDAGMFYWGRAAAWLSLARIFDPHSHAFEVPRWRVQDIDTPDDWRRAELVWGLLRASGHGTDLP